jgi:hypothetical protein
MKDGLHPTDFGQVDAVAVKLETLRITDGLLILLALEARIIGSPLKEVLEGAVKVFNLGLQHLAVRLLQPSVVGLTLEVGHHGVILQEGGEEIVRYFVDEQAVDMASPEASIQRALHLAGAYRPRLPACPGASCPDVCLVSLLLPDFAWSDEIGGERNRR